MLSLSFHSKGGGDDYALQASAGTESGPGGMRETISAAGTVSGSGRMRGTTTDTETVVHWLSLLKFKWKLWLLNLVQQLSSSRILLLYWS